MVCDLSVFSLPSLYTCTRKSTVYFVLGYSISELLSFHSYFHLLYKRVLVQETEALHSVCNPFLELHNCALPNCWWLFICLQGCQCCDNTPPSWGKGGFSCHGYWLCTHRSQYSSEFMFSSPHTQHHRLPIKHQSACGQSGDLFMCQPSRQLAETPALHSLFTQSVIHSTCQRCKISAEPEKRQQNTLLAHYVAASPRCGGHILLALRGRHPLWGTGVLSVIDTTSSPPIVRPLIADCTTEKCLFIQKAKDSTGFCF